MVARKDIPAGNSLTMLLRSNLRYLLLACAVIILGLMIIHQPTHPARERSSATLRLVEMDKVNAYLPSLTVGEDYQVLVDDAKEVCIRRGKGSVLTQPIKGDRFMGIWAGNLLVVSKTDSLESRGWIKNSAPRKLAQAPIVSASIGPDDTILALGRDGTLIVGNKSGTLMKWGGLPRNYFLDSYVWISHHKVFLWSREVPVGYLIDLKLHGIIEVRTSGIDYACADADYLYTANRDGRVGVYFHNGYQVDSFDVRATIWSLAASAGRLYVGTCYWSLHALYDGDFFEYEPTSRSLTQKLGHIGGVTKIAPLRRIGSLLVIRMNDCPLLFDVDSSSFKEVTNCPPASSAAAKDDVLIIAGSGFIATYKMELQGDVPAVRTSERTLAR